MGNPTRDIFVKELEYLETQFEELRKRACAQTLPKGLDAPALRDDIAAAARQVENCIKRLNS